MYFIGLILFLSCVGSAVCYYKYSRRGPQYLRSLSQAKEHIDHHIHGSYQELSKKPSDSNIVEAIKQGTRSGKRVRSALLLDTVKSCTTETRPMNEALQVAVAVEYLHGSSLVVDDMPYFDNDTTRRGNPTCWITFGVATSQMAAVSMLGIALAKLTMIYSPVLRLVLSILSSTIGLDGLAGGQAAELNQDPKSKDLSASTLEDVMNRKTAVFFGAVVAAGWCIGTGITEPTRSMGYVKEAGQSYGRAFQIRDDIEDIEEDTAAGKEHLNYACIHGIEAAEQRINSELQSCRDILETFSLWSQIWKDAFDLIRSEDGSV